MEKRVAIIGGARSSRDLAPYDDPAIELWSLNDMFETLPPRKYDRWFEMHTPKNIREYRPGWNYAAKLAALPCPVYMTEAMPEIPNSREYPLDAMIEIFGGYFTNSIAYMMAMAIAEGYREIQLFGVEMSISSEYVLERPSVEYFVGLARGLGITVIIPDISTLSRGYWLYGYDVPVMEDSKGYLEVSMPVRQIRILTSVAGTDFSFAAGDLVDASDMIAIDLIRAGHAEAVGESKAGQAKNLETAAMIQPEKAVLPKAKPRNKRAGGASEH